MQINHGPKKDRRTRIKPLPNRFTGIQVLVDDSHPVVEIRKDGILYAVAGTWEEARAYAEGRGPAAVELTPEQRGLHAALEADLEGNLIGLAEAAEILSWDKRKLAVYRKRQGFPAPLAELASGPVWHRKQIEEYKSHKEENCIMRITLSQFGLATHLDAAEVIQGDTVIATIAEPETRNNPDFDEDAFREAVLAEVQSWQDYEPGKWVVQFDPGRDNAEEVGV